MEELFEIHRPRLRAVAYRMLGSLTEADDAVQETWLRVARADTGEVTNPAGWLTTITARVCLDALRRRAARPEEPFGMRLPDPVLTAPDGIDPEHEVLLADAVGLALLVVLDTLAPAEVHGAEAIAPQVLSYARMAPFARRVLVNGAVGFVPMPGGQAFAVIALTVRDDRVTAIDIIADPDRLAGLEVPADV